MSQRIRIHQYFGKENGIMVIGSASALNELGKELVAATDGQPETVDDRWPKLAASRDLGGGDGPDSYLSFHVETSKGNIPPTSKESEVAKTVIFVLAIVGVIAIIKWIVAFF